MHLQIRRGIGVGPSSEEEKLQTKSGNWLRQQNAKQQTTAKQTTVVLTSLHMFSMMTLDRRLTTVERSRSARTMSGTMTASVPSSMDCIGQAERYRLGLVQEGAVL